MSNTIAMSVKGDVFPLYALNTSCLCRKMSTVNGRLDPDRCKGTAKKLTNQHAFWLREWDSNEENSVYFSLKTAYKKFVKSGGKELPKEWVEVSCCIRTWWSHITYCVVCICGSECFVRRV